MPMTKVSDDLQEGQRPNPEQVSKDEKPSPGWTEPEKESEKNQMPSNELGRSETPNDDTQANRCNLYIAGIPKHSTEDMLRKAFSPFGSIKSVNIIKDRNTNQQKGFAYIMFSQAKEADEAIEKMDQTNAFNDWKIKVEHAKHLGYRQMSGGMNQSEGRQNYYNNIPGGM